MRGDHNHLLTGACCLVLKRGTQRCPSRIADALGEMVVPYQIGDPQVFEIDQVVVTHQIACYLMMEILALTTDFLVLPGEQLTRRIAAFTTLPLAREPTLRLLELCLC